MLVQIYKNWRKYRKEKSQRDRSRTWQGWVRDRIAPFLYQYVLPATDHIIFAASARCKGCGAGLGYRCSAGIHGEWDCTNVLLGLADPSEKNPDGTWKHPTFPFSFYEIKSENQPSATGATTRPPHIRPHPLYVFWENLNDWATRSKYPYWNRKR